MNTGAEATVSTIEDQRARARRAVGVALASTATGVIVVAHAYTLRLGDETSGVLLVLDHLFTVGIAVTLLGLSSALGTYVLRPLRFDWDSALEAVLLSTAVGVVVLGSVVLACGALGGFQSLTLGLLLGGLSVLARREVAHVPSQIHRAGTELVAKAGVLASVVTAAFILGMLLLAIAPPADYDTLMYHLHLPAQFLQRGSIFVPEDNLHVAYVGPLHMLYMPLVAVGAPSAAAVVNTLFAAGLAVVVLVAAYRFLTPTTGRLAMLLTWGSGILLLVGITPKIDVTLAFYAVAAQYAVLRAATAPKPLPWFALTGLLLGACGAVKYLGLVNAVALVPFTVGAAIYTARNRRASGPWLPLLVVAAMGTITVLPWIIKNWLLFDAPFYPFLSAPLLQPWLAAIHGSPAFPASIDPAQLRPLANIREPFDVVSWFVAPERLTPETEGAWYRANLAFLFAPLALPLMRNWRLATLVVPGVFYVGCVLAVERVINVRYLIPAIPALTIAAAAVFAAVMRGAHRRVALLVVGAVVAVSLAVPALGLVLQLTLRNAPAHALGRLSREQYWTQNRLPEIASFGAMTRRVEQHLPSDARVLLLFEARGLGFKRVVLQDNGMTNWSLLASVLKPTQCLQNSGITHVLVNQGAIGYFRARGLNTDSILWNQFDAFAERCLTPIYRDAVVDLYAVRSR